MSSLLVGRCALAFLLHALLATRPCHHALPPTTSSSCPSRTCPSFPFPQDFRNLTTIVEWLAWAEPEYDFKPVVGEWVKEVLKELDFRLEAGLLCSPTPASPTPVSSMPTPFPLVSVLVSLAPSPFSRLPVSPLALTLSSCHVRKFLPKTSTGSSLQPVHTHFALPTHSPASTSLTSANLERVARNFKQHQVEGGSSTAPGTGEESSGALAVEASVPAVVRATEHVLVMDAPAVIACIHCSPSTPHSLCPPPRAPFHPSANLERVARNFQQHELAGGSVGVESSSGALAVEAIVPAVVRATERVLVMEFVQGVRLSDLPALDALQVDRQVLLNRIARAYAHQIYVGGFFNADPHPGNFLVSDQPPHLPVLLDFGLTKAVDHAKRVALAKMLLAAAEVGMGVGREREGEGGS
ncbi:unnamed protein product [Closterium sp. NIES-54]